MASFDKVSRDMYNDFAKRFQPYEQQMLEAVNDTSLIDAAVTDSATQNRLASGIQQRNMSRYGGTAGTTAVQRQEQAKSLSLGMVKNTTGSTNLARRAQRDINYNNLVGVANYGQKLQADAMQGLGQVNSLAANRADAYNTAQKSHKASLWGAAGQVGSMAVTALAI